MSELRYIGPRNNRTPLTNTELRDKSVETVTQDQITSAIDNELADKASASYLDSSVAGKVLKADLPSYGNGKLARSTLNTANGPVALSGGRVSNTYMPALSGGRTWRNLGNSPSWSTGVLGSSTIDSSPLILATWSLPNIGYPYIPIFIGNCQLGDPGGAELQIRRNSSTGPMYARAVSANTATYNGCQIMPAGSVQAISSGTFYIVAGKKFSGTTGSAIGAEYSLSCFAVPS